MFGREDYTYSQMKKDSAIDWLNQLLTSEDVINRHGAKITLDHIETLNRRIKELEDKNALKDQYLKKLKSKA
ncbi:MAG: hypothetical protein J6F30_00705 [Cellulosilyticum sp.]|nr:hypothetical protein [Cellulosilyticum sp.]